jgi:hypothetical protein
MPHRREVRRSPTRGGLAFSNPRLEDTMHRCERWLAGVGMALLVFGAAAWADGEKISPDKLPAKVMAAVKERFPNPEFTSITKEMENNAVIYDIEFKHKGKKYEMDIKEDGTVVEIEKEVAVKDLAAAVTKAIEAKYPKSTIKEIMEVNLVNGKEEKPDRYEIIIETADKKTLELEVSLDGKSIKGGEAEKDKK